MNPIVYNVSNLIGILLIAVGAGLMSISAGLIAGGVLVIGLSIFNLWIGGRG